MQNRLLRAALLALALPLTATAAWAQCQTNRLAPNTVIGRLGIGAGPCEQVPIALLLANQNIQTATANLTAFLALNSTGFPVRTGTNTWAQRSILGTSGRITVTNGDGVSGAPTIDISATYAGQTSIITLGTITAGTWHGSVIHQSYGGFGSDVAGANGVPLFVLGVPTFTATTGTGLFMRANAPTLAGNLILNGNWISGDGGNEGIKVDSSGNVGIGVAPGVNFHVRIGANENIIFQNVGGTARIAFYNDGLGAPVSGAIDANPLYLNANSGSFVGVATANPNHALDVNGNIGIAASGYLNWGTTDGTSGYGLRDNSGTVQIKNLAGSWVNVPTSGTTQWTTASGNLYFNTGGVSVGTTLLATGAAFQVGGSQYNLQTNPTMQQANCWGFANNCETAGFLSILNYTTTSPGGSAVRGDASRTVTGVVIGGVSGSARAFNSGGDTVGVLGSTLFTGGESSATPQTKATGYGGWFFTYICGPASVEPQCAGGTLAHYGDIGLISGVNRGEVVPRYGLVLSKEGYAETNNVGCCVTGVYLTDFTQKGFHAFNNKGAAWGFYQDNGSSTQNFGVDATGRVSFVGGTSTLTTLCYNTSDHGGIATIAACASDRRLKNERGAVPDGALDIVRHMKPSRFDFKNDPTQKLYAGFYAQDLQPEIPESVTTGMDGEHLTVINDALIAYIVKAVQELDARTAK